MAFAKAQLRAFSSAGAALGGGGTRSARLWHYITNDDWSTINVAGYWNGARNYVAPGDIVFISGDMDGTPVFRQVMFATVPAAGNLTVVQVVNS
jgi:hypothetical protein